MTAIVWAIVALALLLVGVAVWWYLRRSPKIEPPVVEAEPRAYGGAENGSWDDPWRRMQILGR
jgi:hypothetical protein